MSKTTSTKTSARPPRESRPPRSPRQPRSPRSPRSSRSPRTGRAVMVAFAILVTTIMVGCASFSTAQVEERFDPDTGRRTGIISTKVGANTLFDSKSALANFRASQSEKTQSANVGSLSQEANSTNAVLMLQAMAQLISALPK